MLDGTSDMADSPAAEAPDRTGVGSYFVATYPPFSVWTEEAVAGEALPAELGERFRAHREALRRAREQSNGQPEVRPSQP